ncbi:hypothetical protein ACRRTK_005378 [Alexandromys fortis]
MTIKDTCIGPSSESCSLHSPCDHHVTDLSSRWPHRCCTDSHQQSPARVPDLTVEDPVTVEYITRYIASLKQHYTQSNGRRPFGISALIGAKSVSEFLEKNYTDDAIETDNLTIKVVTKALLEVVQSGGKNIELVVMRWDQPLKILNPEEIEKYVAKMENEKEENEMKKQKKASS